MIIAKLLTAISKSSGKLSARVINKFNTLNSVMENKIVKIQSKRAAKKVFTPILPPKFNSLKEIKQFNKDILGIKHFDIDDFDTAEWVTKGLNMINNDARGKLKFPKRFKLAECKATDGIEGFMGYMRKKDTVLIDKNLIAQAKQTSKNNGESLADFMKKFGRTKMDGTEHFIRGDYQPLYHELGHSMHSRAAKDYNKMSRLTELKTLGLKDDTVVREFVENIDIQKTAGKISEYAKCSPNEFVAETFSLLAQGKKLPDDVMTLYKKYNGPMLDCFQKGSGSGGGNGFQDILNDFMGQAGSREVTLDFLTSEAKVLALPSMTLKKTSKMPAITSIDLAINTKKQKICIEA